MNFIHFSFKQISLDIFHIRYLLARITCPHKIKWYFSHNLYYLPKGCCYIAQVADTALNTNLTKNKGYNRTANYTFYMLKRTNSDIRSFKTLYISMISPKILYLEIHSYCFKHLMLCCVLSLFYWSFGCFVSHIFRSMLLWLSHFIVTVLAYWMIWCESIVQFVCVSECWECQGIYLQCKYVFLWWNIPIFMHTCTLKYKY